MQLSLVLILPALALANPVPNPTLEERQSPAVPVQLPTGTPCQGVPQKNPVTAAELAAAVAPCVGVQPNGSDFTRNDVVNGVCKPETFIFARGTTEDPNLGNIVGPPFLVALDAVFGGSKNVAAQGVNDYPAIGADYCAGGSETAAVNLQNLIIQTYTQCPTTKLLVSGYSQGSQVVHNAFRLLKTSNPAAAKFVNAVVTFGDPDRNIPLDNVPSYKWKVDCHAGDNICQDGSNVFVPHVTYCRDVAVYAAFAKLRSLANN